MVLFVVVMDYVKAAGGCVTGVGERGGRGGSPLPYPTSILERKKKEE